MQLLQDSLLNFSSPVQTQHDLKLLITPVSTYLPSLQTMYALLAATWWRGQQQHWGMTNEQHEENYLIKFNSFSFTNGRSFCLRKMEDQKNISVMYTKLGVPYLLI